MYIVYDQVTETGNPLTFKTLCSKSNRKHDSLRPVLNNKTPGRYIFETDIKEFQPTLKIQM